MFSFLKEDGSIDARELTRIFREAVAYAIEEHRLAGKSISVFRSGKVVLIPPEQIEPLEEKLRMIKEDYNNDT
jgi:hypothetical protein